MMSKSLPSTVQRVPLHTDSSLNDRILEGTAHRVLYYSGHREEIGDRLRQLDREWDIERLLGDRRWLWLPGLVAAFLFQHAVQGWCPPIPVLRRLGVRTAREIELERVSLKALRGDFDEINDAGQALEAAAR